MVRRWKATCCFISAISNLWHSRQLTKLSEICNNIQIDAVRVRKRQKVSIFEIVVGDVICLKIGDHVPADGLFLDGHSLQVDESIITGESDHVPINCSLPFCFQVLMCMVDGYARMLVTSVGMNTTRGEMMSSSKCNTNELQTPLQAQLSKLSTSISKVGLAIAFVVLLVMLVRYLTGNMKCENENKEFQKGESYAENCSTSGECYVANCI